MNIFSRRVEIGGDVGVTYPKQCAWLNNYLLLIECISIVLDFHIF